MWKAAAGQSVKVAVDDEVDDWETDPDFEVRPPTPPAPHPLLTPSFSTALPDCAFSVLE